MGSQLVKKFLTLVSIARDEPHRLLLRTHLIVLVLAAVLPLLIFGTIMFWREMDVQRVFVERGMRDTVRALSLAVDREIGQVLSVLTTLAASPHLDVADFKSFHELSSRVSAERPGSWIVLFDRSGQQLSNTRRVFGAPLPNPVRDAVPLKTDLRYPELPIGGPDSVKQSVSTGQPVISDLFIALTSKKPAIAVSVPVLRNGQVHYALEMVIEPSVLSELIAEQHTPADWHASIVDRRGIVIGRMVDADRFVGRPAAPQLRIQLAHSGEEWGLIRTREGTPAYNAFKRSNATGWAVTISAPRSSIDAAVNRSVGLMASGAAFLLLLALGLAIALGRRIAAPIASLARSAEAIQQGQPVALKGSAVREVERLHRALVQAGIAARAAELERERRLVAETKQQEAEAANRKITGILESMSDGFLVLDREWRFTYLNSRSTVELRRLGPTGHDVLGKVAWEIFPDLPGTPPYDALQRVATEGVSVSYERFCGVLNEWYDERAYPTPDGVAIYWRNVTARKERQRRSAANLAITQVLAESLSLSDAAPRILEVVGSRLGWQVGFFWIVASQDHELRCLNSWHDPAAAAERFTAASEELTFVPGIGLPGRVWSSLKPAWIPDVRQDTNSPRAHFAVESGLRAAFAFPIQSRSKLIGVMEFFRREVKSADTDVLRMFESIGSQIGQFVERRDAEEALRRSEANLRDFVETATVGLHWVDADGTILWANPGGTRYAGLLEGRLHRPLHQRVSHGFRRHR